ncbi:MAG: hypothetical protein C0596_17845 [Marinilabiliales bacterium]|nr:MAG: hypothetical protein C0596_17845 [Marinilabiliales bacterium]
MKRKVLQLLLFAIVPGLLTAQEISKSSVNSAGTEYTNENLSINWTLGQTAISTISSDNAIITQGFQQNTYSFTDITSDITSEVNISMYPNPTSDLVYIDINNEDFTHGIIEITDITGRLIDKKEISGSKTQLSLNQYSSEIFLISIKQENRIMRTFKIIKNQ